LKAVGLALLAFLVAVIGTDFVRRYALKRELLDIPNERSSHNRPTPRGGGLAIVLATMLPFVVLARAGMVDRNLLSALVVGGGAVAAVGYLDDRFRLSARIRLTVHFGAAIWALWQLGGLPTLQIFNHTVSPGPIGYAVGAMGIVWVLNLFNFMDGIDGIAASESSFIGLAAALLAWVAGDGIGAVFSSSLVLSAACFGFLVWNWPPAKIFMGDIGSGYLGFVIAVLAIAAARESPVALFVWLILGALFFADATVTLIRRLIRGERVYEAHRSHAYQVLARRWSSHRAVTIMVSLINLFVLLPIAWVAMTRPGWAPLIAAAVLTALAIVVLLVGKEQHWAPKIDR
jgi:Fuc2NAc and GlcNAc transferase